MKSMTIYFIENSYHFNSWFSGNSWAEGNMIFVQGAEHLKEVYDHMDNMITDTTQSHVAEIRGSANHVKIIGVLKETQSFDDIKNCTTIDIIHDINTSDIDFDFSHPTKNAMIATISSYAILSDVSKLKIWAYQPAAEEKYIDGFSYLP
jgi:hypothetical protein